MEVGSLMSAGRLYKTGDRVRWLADGRLDFLGRVDFQIKINGQRVETGEIESVLSQGPGVRDALVIAKATSGGTMRLVAYVLGDGVDTASVLDVCRTQLPVYMVPSAVVELAEWPLNANGKVDRKQLPDPQWDAATEELAVPEDTLELGIAKAFGEVMQTSSVGRNTSFFALGGDSILAIRAVSVARGFGVGFTVVQLMQHQTPAQLASVARVLDETAIQIVGAAPASGTVPLTPTQRWFFFMDFTDVNHWNQAISLRFPGETTLDLGQLQQALHHLESHHDMLRCRYRVAADGTWCQYIPERGTEPPVLEVVKATARTNLDKKLTALQGSLDLIHGPVWRGAVIQTPKQPDRVVLVFHHLVMDAVAWGIIEEDLGCAYFGRPLPRRTTSFAAWSHRLDRFLSTVPPWAPAAAPPLLLFCCSTDCTRTTAGGCGGVGSGEGSILRCLATTSTLYVFVRGKAI